MKKQLVSFREFLKTGTLGPISTNMRMVEVAATLGVPDYWITDSAVAVPVYWGFGKLEICFAEDSPHRVNWFQIEHAGYLEGEFEIITAELALALDGLNGSTKPSEFLSAGIWEPEATAVYYAILSGDIMLNICAHNVQIHFQVKIDPQIQTKSEEIDIQKYIYSIIEKIDSNTSIDSIYSYRMDAKNEISPALDWNAMSGRDYLDHLHKLATSETNAD